MISWEGVGLYQKCSYVKKYALPFGVAIISLVLLFALTFIYVYLGSTQEFIVIYIYMYFELVIHTL